MQDDPILLATIVETALEEIPRLLASIRQALDEGNSVDLRLAAHTLKGSLRYFGAAPAVEQAYRLERMGQEGDFGAAAEALRTLDAETQEVVRCLSQYLDADYKFSWTH